MGSGYAGKYENTYGNKSYDYEKKLNDTTETVKAISGVKTTIDKNAELVRDKYELNDEGYFGETTKTKAQIFRTKTPIDDSYDFYNKLGQGGKIENLNNGHGTKTTLSDGTIITHRVVTSTEGSPAVDIHIYSPSFVKTQKIHFIYDVGE